MTVESPHHHHHATARGDRVSVSETIGLGFGRIASDGTHGTLHVLVSPVYNMTLGLNPALISTIVFIHQPGHPWLPLGIIMMNGMTNAGVSLMGIAMLGDIADCDEYETGLRREGLFVALLSWFDKAGNSLGSFLTGFILLWIGFNAKLGAQSQHTLRLMKFSYIAMPALGAMLTLAFIHRYSLRQDQVYAIKGELAHRRAALAGAPMPCQET